MAQGCGDDASAGMQSSDDAALSTPTPNADASVQPTQDAQSAAAPEAGAGNDASARDAAREDASLAMDARADAGPPVSSSDASTEPGSAQDAARDTSVPPDAPSGADAAALDRCNVGVHDPSKPPTVLTLSGNLGTHDPTVIEQGGTFYEFQTGPRVLGKTSTNLTSWQGTPSALGSANPAWVAREVPGATDLWAPDISFFNGQVHLYYSVSTFGSNSSCIGHATRASLSSGSFRDQGGPVVCSNHGSRDDWNAIDPNLVLDEAGAPFLVFGSFWSGIKAIELNADGTRKGTALHALASRGGGPIEAPVVVRRCGYYYLFVSFDKCCAGVDSTYNIRVGRSQKLLGPYLDKSGKPMLEGGGSLLVASAGRWHGPGHNTVLFSGTRAYNIYHAYDGNAGGASVLRVAELVWDKDGWPISGGP
jgi:arabinan endo-1,5-alpha-L-arabinosidase